MKLIKGLLRWMLILVLIGASVVVARTIFRASQPNAGDAGVPEIIDETIVERGDLRVTVSGTGGVLPSRQVPLVFESVGMVQEILVREGDRVMAGTPLARLEAAELERAVSQAELALELQQIAYDALLSPPRPEDIAVAEAAVAAAQASLNAAYSTGTTAQQIEISRLQAELARNQLWQAQLQRDLSVNASSGGAGFSIDVGALIPDEFQDDVPQEAIDRANQALTGALAGSLPSFPSADASSFSAGLNQAEFGVQIADAQAIAAQSRNPSAGAIAQSNAALVTAQAQLNRLLNGAGETDLQLAEMGIAQAQLTLDQAYAALGRATLIAPFDGTIAGINLRQGEPPSTQQPAILLVDTDPYFVDLAIDETDVVRLELGQPVELRLDALADDRLVGEVVRIAAAPIVSGQLVTYPVRVQLDATDEPVRIGMSATATIIVDALEDALVLSNRFIRIDRATQNAFVTVERESDRYEEIQVQLGLRNEVESEIVSGLNEGDRVVLLPRGTFDIFNGR